MSSTKHEENIDFSPLNEVPVVPSTVLAMAHMRLLNIGNSARLTEE